ncbi:Tir chaperone protein (CesT) [compost metagenome]
MPISETFTELLNAFATVIGQTEIPVDERGICSFMVDDSVAVNLALDAGLDGMVIFSPLGAPPAAHLASWQVRMLRANGAGGGAYVFGMAPASDTAILSSHRPLASLSGALLASWVGEFVDVARHWRDAFAQGAEPDAPAAPAADAWLQV